MINSPPASTFLFNKSLEYDWHTANVNYLSMCMSIWCNQICHEEASDVVSRKSHYAWEAIDQGVHVCDSVEPRPIDAPVAWFPAPSARAGFSINALFRSIVHAACYACPIDRLTDGCSIGGQYKHSRNPLCSINTWQRNLPALHFRFLNDLNPTTFSIPHTFISDITCTSHLTYPPSFFGDGDNNNRHHHVFHSSSPSISSLPRPHLSLPTPRLCLRAASMPQRLLQLVHW